MTLLHATCVAIDGCGVLLRGAPGIGKSDLALRLVDGGGNLVADDQVSVSQAGGALRARAPENLRGLLEVRGLGIVRAATLAETQLRLAVDLIPHAPTERLPRPDHCLIEGVALPRIRIVPHHASAAAVIRLAVRTLADGGSLASALGDATPATFGAIA